MSKNPEPELCPKCHTKILVAPGIGPFCPNKNCDVIDNIQGVDTKVTVYIPRSYEDLRKLILTKLTNVLSFYGEDPDRWAPVKEQFLRYTATNLFENGIITKKGKRTLKEMTIEDLLKKCDKLTDNQLLEILVVAARRYAKQR